MTRSSLRSRLHACLGLAWAPADRRDGSILVVVLLLVGLIAALASAAAEMHRATYAAGLAYADGLRAEMAMRSAIERTVAHGGDRTQQLRGGVVHLEQASVTLDIRDETGRIDLNFASPELLAGLLRAVGLDEKAAQENADKIVAWRERLPADSPKGAQKRVAPDGVAFPTNPFLHPAQIAQVPDFGRAAAVAVLPHLTVASSRPTINPLLADLPVLLAVPGMSLDQANAFLRERREQPALFDKLVQEIKNGRDYMALTTGAAVRFHGRVRIANRTERDFEAVVAVVSGDSVPYRMLSWEATVTKATVSVR